MGRIGTCLVNRNLRCFFYRLFQSRDASTTLLLSTCIPFYLAASSQQRLPLLHAPQGSPRFCPCAGRRANQSRPTTSSRSLRPHQGPRLLIVCNRHTPIPSRGRKRIWFLVCSRAIRSTRGHCHPITGLAEFRRLVTIQHIYSLRSSPPRTSLRLPPLYIAMCVCVQTRDLQGNRIRTIFSPLPIFRCPDHPPPNTQRRHRALPSTTWHREILLNIFLLWQHPRPEWM